MDFISYFPEPWGTYLVIPLLIFFARILDVSVGTLRIILVSKGYKFVAPILGFAEVFIWLVAIGQIMQNLNNIWNYFAYATGFATGTYIGMYIEQKLSLGLVIVRIITQYDATALVKHIREQNFTATVLDAKGNYGDVKVIFMIVKRASLNTLTNTIKQFNPNAFYSVEDVRLVSGGILPYQPNPIMMRFGNLKRIFTIRK